MLRAVIVLRAIAKLSQSLNRPPILDQLDLELRAGETCGLCGPGAGGKSLLLKILCGLVRPDAGTVSVDGVDLQLSLIHISSWPCPEAGCASGGSKTSRGNIP